MAHPKAIVIVGPTASGKTAMGVALAKQWNGAIVSADSRQVYRGMDIGTGKMATTTVDGIAQYMVDIVDPDEPYTLADYQRDAKHVMGAIWQQGKLPIIVGGTGLYVRALVDHLDIPAVRPNATIRAELESRLAREGIAALVAELRAMDPTSAAVIDTGNPRRVIRAFEVVRASGASFQKQQKKNPPFFDALQIGIDVPRAELDRRIDARVDTMIERGLEQETRTLLASFDPALPAFSGIGYAEMVAVITGRLSNTDAIAQIKKRTRAYARRQMTWFRKDKRIRWVTTADEALALVSAFL